MSSTGARGRKSVEGRAIEGLIKNEEEFIQGLKVFTNRTGVGSTPGEGLGGSLPTAGEASNAKILNIGDLSDPFEIDFAIMNSDFLSAKITQNTVITFTNIPIDLFMNLRLYIRTTDPIITIDGNIASGVGSSPLIVTAIDDFLDISLKSTDQVNVTFEVVKKNDELDIIPGIPVNVQAIGSSPTTINVIWDPPPTGSQPITYDVAFSLGPAGTPANGPDVHAPGSPDNDLTSNEHVITGLVSATTYYVWIRAKNSEGNSDFVGPFQTNTDGIANPAGVNFAIPGGTILWNSVTINFDAVAGAFYTLTRTATVSGEIEILRNNDAAAGPVVDDEGIEPDTDYDYKIVVRNGFGANIGQATINVDTPSIPAPVLTLTAVGRKLKFEVAMLANIGIFEFQWALSSDFLTSPSSIRTFARPLPFDVSSDSIESPELLPDTLFFGRVRFNKFGILSPFSTVKSVTTGTLLTPSKPTLTVTSPASGEVRIKVKYEDTVSRDEIALCTWRLASSVQEYFDTIFLTGGTVIANSYSRNIPPGDDLNSAENRVEVIRDGAWSPGDNISVRCVCTNASGTSIADIKNVIIDV